MVKIGVIFNWVSKALEFIDYASQHMKKIQESIDGEKEAKRVLNVRATNYGMQGDTGSLQAYYEVMAKRNIDDGTANAVLRELTLQMTDKIKFEEEMEKLGIKGKDFALLKDPVAVFAKIMERAEAAEDAAPFLKYMQEKLKIKNDELLFMFTDEERKKVAFKERLEDSKNQKEIEGILAEREAKFIETIAKDIAKRGSGNLQEEVDAQRPQFDLDQEKINKDWKDPKNRERIREEHGRETPNSAPSPAAQESTLKAPATVKSPDSGESSPAAHTPEKNAPVAAPSSNPRDSYVPAAFGDQVTAVTEKIATVLEGVQALRNIQFIEKPFDNDMRGSSSFMLAKLDEILGYAKEPRAEYAITVNSSSQELPQAGDALGWQGWAGAVTASGVA